MNGANSNGFAWFTKLYFLQGAMTKKEAVQTPPNIRDEYGHEFRALLAPYLFEEIPEADVPEAEARLEQIHTLFLLYEAVVCARRSRE